MDVVLELADTFFFDRCYANLLPISSAVASSFAPISTLAAGFKAYDVNATWDAATGLLAGESARSGWQWEPSSQFFSLPPSEYAYMSRWDRDNIYRQAVSLYLLTW